MATYRMASVNADDRVRRECRVERVVLEDHRAGFVRCDLDVVRLARAGAERSGVLADLVRWKRGAVLRDHAPEHGRAVSLERHVDAVLRADVDEPKLRRLSRAHIDGIRMQLPVQQRWRAGRY